MHALSLIDPRVGRVLIKLHPLYLTLYLCIQVHVSDLHRKVISELNLTRILRIWTDDTLKRDSDPLCLAVLFSDHVLFHRLPKECHDKLTHSHPIVLGNAFQLLDAIVTWESSMLYPLWCFSWMNNISFFRHDSEFEGNDAGLNWRDQLSPKLLKYVSLLSKYYLPFLLVVVLQVQQHAHEAQAIGHALVALEHEDRLLLVVVGDEYELVLNLVIRISDTLFFC